MECETCSFLYVYPSSGGCAAAGEAPEPGWIECELTGAVADDPSDYDALWSECTLPGEDDCNQTMAWAEIMPRYDAAVMLMDAEIRERLAREVWGSQADFLAAYAQAHSAKYGVNWELAKPNPTW